MSARKYLTIGVVVGLGILNGFYTFNPSLQEAQQRREGSHIHGQAAPTQKSETQQPEPASAGKPDGAVSAEKPAAPSKASDAASKA
ncbi:hypothetical protein QBC46DRAFT_369395 [Diplogelasinospora grovesii]|uniref:Uncharacterized protein n=1 Tax=Diplogelasinospora grovesii TaxID=303347 RepID=A0AAN6SAA9_9PEZI|nr:hypothetical protein QBC46DRAFT_369395 [Diplogelasinospora grovesii]